MPSTIEPINCETSYAEVSISCLHSRRAEMDRPESSGSPERGLFAFVAFVEHHRYMNPAVSSPARNSFGLMSETSFV